MGVLYAEESRPESSKKQGLNLLDVVPLARLVRWGGFPYVFQILFLGVFFLIAALGWDRYTPDGVPDKLYAKTNIVNLIIWGLWWPSMVWVAVLFGRLWCAVCPLELVSNVSERFGARMGFRQRNLAKWLRAGWAMLLIYLVVQMLVAGVHMHRVPMYTALFMLSLLVAAFAVGLVMKDRAFCRGFCPVGLLLGTYGQGSMLAVRAARADACAACEGKDCIMACNRQRLDARSCPSLLNPPKLNTNKDCLICGQCIKSCKPDNMQILLRPPFSAHDMREPLASWPVTLFVLAVSGFVSYEVSGAWNVTKAAFLWVPEISAVFLGLDPANGWLKGVWMLVVFPLLIWIPLGGLTMVLGGARRMGDAWRKLALPIAVVVASAHMAKGLEKVATWGGFLPGAFGEPVGINTASAIHSGTLAIPGPLVPHAVYAGFAFALIPAGFAYAVREVFLRDPVHWKVQLMPLLGLACGFAGCVLGWAF